MGTTGLAPFNNKTEAGRKRIADASAKGVAARTKNRDEAQKAVKAINERTDRLVTLTATDITPQKLIDTCTVGLILLIERFNNGELTIHSKDAAPFALALNTIRRLEAGEATTHTKHANIHTETTSERIKRLQHDILQTPPPQAANKFAEQDTVVLEHEPAVAAMAPQTATDDTTGETE